MIMKTETYTLNLTEKQFELLDIIMFEEWRDCVDVGPDDENYNCKYMNDHPDMFSVDDFKSVQEVFRVEKERKGFKGHRY